MSVCQTTFESLDIGSSFFSPPVHLNGIRVKIVYEGHRVKVKVTGAKKVETPVSGNVYIKIRSALTLLL